MSDVVNKVGSQVAGRIFESTEVIGHALVKGTTVQLTFSAEKERVGRISAWAGCNHLFGEVAFYGDRMEVSELASTRMACEEPLMEQDQWLTGFLQAGPQFALNGDELTLSLGLETIKLGAIRSKPDGLTGIRWVVESLIDGQAVSSVPQGVEAFLEFEGDRVTGNAGCNQLGGQAVRGRGKITFSKVATTKMACADDRMAVERVVLRVLDREVAMRIDGGMLELKHPTGTGLRLRSPSEPRRRAG